MISIIACWSAQRADASAAYFLSDFAPAGLEPMESEMGLFDDIAKAVNNSLHTVQQAALNINLSNFHPSLELQTRANLNSVEAALQQGDVRGFETSGINGKMFVGTAGDNYIYGTDRDDSINGMDGNDHIYAGKGNDTVLGSRGDNSLTGGSDYLDGGEGDDGLLGLDGHDTLIGGPGKDGLDGGSQGDNLTGGADADKFYYKSVSDSTRQDPDQIMDFNRADGDKVDLHYLVSRF